MIWDEFGSLFGLGAHRYWKVSVQVLRKLSKNSQKDLKRMMEKRERKSYGFGRYRLEEGERVMFCEGRPVHLTFERYIASGNENLYNPEWKSLEQ
jgi:hypothetical protein